MPLSNPHDRITRNQTDGKLHLTRRGTGDRRRLHRRPNARLGRWRRPRLRTPHRRRQNLGIASRPGFPDRTRPRRPRRGGVPRRLKAGGPDRLWRGGKTRPRHPEGRQDDRRIGLRSNDRAGINRPGSNIDLRSWVRQTIAAISPPNGRNNRHHGWRPDSDGRSISRDLRSRCQIKALLDGGPMLLEQPVLRDPDHLTTCRSIARRWRRRRRRQHRESTSNRGVAGDYRANCTKSRIRIERRTRRRDVTRRRRRANCGSGRRPRPWTSFEPKLGSDRNTRLPRRRSKGQDRYPLRAREPGAPLRRLPPIVAATTFCG